MSFGILVQVLVDLVLFAGVAFVWVKLTRPQKDDPRLSRGLQLLQSKIAVLEDLSDQIETQVQQLTGLLEAKAKEVQTQILAADKQIQKIETSMNKSMEVAEIFQDRIPHEEIIERQNTLKYVKAARMAHQGSSLDEIAEAVDLSRGEIEMIAKVNREQLQFSEDELPEWAKKELGLEIKAPVQPGLDLKPLARAEDRSAGGDSAHLETSLAAAAQLPKLAFAETAPAGGTARLETTRSETARPETSLANLGEKFRQNLTASPAASPFQEAKTGPVIEMPSNPLANKASAGRAAPQVRETAKTSSGKSVEIQKVVFPKIDVNDHLS